MQPLADLAPRLVLVPFDPRESITLAVAAKLCGKVNEHYPFVGSATRHRAQDWRHLAHQPRGASDVSGWRP